MLDTATTIADRLNRDKEGTGLRIRMPNHVWQTADTKGWMVGIGDLGMDRAILEIWYDRFTGYPDRKLWAGFCSDDPIEIKTMTGAPRSIFFRFGS